MASAGAADDESNPRCLNVWSGPRCLSTRCAEALTTLSLLRDDAPPLSLLRDDAPL
jgi:hypothetical protein